jgi:hypothetical protein
MPDTTELPRDIPEKPPRSKPNTRVFRGIDLRTTKGRRIRHLYTGYAAQVGEMDDLIVQAATIKVAKLQVIVERLQDELLKAKRHHRRLGDELVRHENLLRRAKAELTAMIKQPIPWWEDDNAEAEEN